MRKAPTRRETICVQSGWSIKGERIVCTLSGHYVQTVEDTSFPGLGLSATVGTASKPSGQIIERPMHCHVKQIDDNKDHVWTHEYILGSSGLFLCFYTANRKSYTVVSTPLLLILKFHFKYLKQYLLINRNDGKCTERIQTCEVEISMV